MPATLTAVVEVRSQLVHAVLRYLDTLATKMAELPAYYPVHVRRDATGATRFDDIRQLVQVVQDRSVFEQWLVAERERLRAAGQAVDDRWAYAPFRARPEHEDSDRTMPRDRPAPPPPVPWDEQAGTRFPRAIILGDPGFGKTWLLHYEARRLAQAGAQGLRARTLTLHDLVLPVFARLSDVNRRDDPLDDALVAGALADGGYSEAVHCFVRAKLSTPHCALLLDAWDEVPVEIPPPGQPVAYLPHFRQRLGQRLAAFARQYPHLRMLITSRIVSYLASPIPGMPELELLAFDTRYIEAFARLWFDSERNTTLAQQFLALVREHPQVRGLARIPLMLALLCRAYQEEKLTFPTRRVDLYNRCLRGLLRDWKEEKQQRRISDLRLTKTLSRLAQGSFRLQVAQKEQFTELEFAEALGFNLEPDTQAEQAEKFIESLKDDGILITAGADREAPLLFLHRTFHEYLAACALAQQKNGYNVVRAHMCDPAWEEVLKLLGGLLKEHTAAYIALLVRENAHDLLCRPLRLAVGAAVEACADYLPHALSEGLLKEVIALYFDPPAWLLRNRLLSSLITPWGERAIPHLLTGLEIRRLRRAATEALGRIGAREAVFPLLRHLHDDRDQSMRMKVAEALGRIGAREAVFPLLRHLHDDRDQSMRMKVAEALGRIGTSEAISQLLPLLKTIVFSRVVIESLDYMAPNEAISQLLLLLKTPALSREAAEALGRIGTPETVSQLLPLLKTPALSREAAEALGRIGTPETVSQLLPLLKTSKSYFQEGRLAGSWKEVVSVLGQIGSPEAVSQLLSLLEDEELNREEKEIVVDALGETGSLEAVPHLLSLLENKDPYLWSVQQEAIIALGHIGSNKVVPHLLPLLEDEERHWSEKEGVVEALGHIGSDQAVSSLLPLLEDENLRRAVAEALGQIGSPQAESSLLSLLEDNLWAVRVTAVKALSTVGSATSIPYLLRQLVAERDIDVLNAVGETLEQIGQRHKALLPVIETPPSIQDWAHSLAQSLETLVTQWP